MSVFREWARRWNVPAEAVAEYERALGVLYTVEHAGDKSEAYVASQMRLEAAELGIKLWRNNVGAGALVESGSFIRFGLANESERQNTIIKSHDWVGWFKRLITQDMVGTFIAEFISRETKKQGWRYTGTPREVAQSHWGEAVMADGGDARFVSGPGSFDHLKPLIYRNTP